MAIKSKIKEKPAVFSVVVTPKLKDKIRGIATKRKIWSLAEMIRIILEAYQE